MGVWRADRPRAAGVSRPPAALTAGRGRAAATCGAATRWRRLRGPPAAAACSRARASASRACGERTTTRGRGRPSTWSSQRATTSTTHCACTTARRSAPDLPARTSGAPSSTSCVRRRSGCPSCSVCSWGPRTSPTSRACAGSTRRGRAGGARGATSCGWTSGRRSATSPRSSGGTPSGAGVWVLRAGYAHASHIRGPWA